MYLNSDDRERQVLSELADILGRMSDRQVLMVLNMVTNEAAGRIVR